MSQVSPVFHTEVRVSIGLKNKLRVGISIPEYQMSMLVGRAMKTFLLSDSNLSSMLLKFECPALWSQSYMLRSTGFSWLFRHLKIICHSSHDLNYRHLTLLFKSWLEFQTSERLLLFNEPWWLGSLERQLLSRQLSLAIGGSNLAWVYAWYWPLTMLTHYMYPLHKPWMCVISHVIGIMCSVLQELCSISE